MTLDHQAIVNYIKHEVSKFLKAKRVNDQTLSQLDAKIQLELYLREKKEAILLEKMRRKESQGSIEAAGSSALEEV